MDGIAGPTVQHTTPTKNIGLCQMDARDF
jgi:hypothetical protein